MIWRERGLWALLSVAVVLYFLFKPEQAPTGQHIEATTAPQIKKVPTVSVPTAPVKAYAPEAKKKLKLPPRIQQDKSQHVVSATRTKADERPHTVTTVLDADTGEVTTYDRAEPLPWVAVNSKSELGVYYGLNGVQQAIRVEGRHELLQVKALHMGAIASADVMRGDVDGFIGVGVWARW